MPPDNLELFPPAPRVRQPDPSQSKPAGLPVLPSSPVGKPSRRPRDWRSGNLEAARIILSEPAKYPGLLAEWAERIVNPCAK